MTLAALALVAAPARASEQPLAELPEPLEGSVRAGPVRLQPFFRVEELGYDDNIFLSTTGEERSDWTARLAGGVRGQVLFGNRAVLSFEERPAYTVFLKTSSQNFVNNTFEARTDLFVRDLNLFLGSSWTTSRQRANSEFDERTRVRTRRVFGGAGWRLERKLSFAASLSRQRLRYTDRNFFATETTRNFECSAERAVFAGSPEEIPIGTLLDRVEDEASLRASYRLFGRSRVFLEGAAGRSRFGSCPGRDARQSSVMAGLAFDPTARLAGAVQAGPARFDSDRADRPDFRGLLGEADLTLRPSERWKLSAQWERSVPFSIFRDNLFRIETSGGLIVSRALRGRVAIEAGGELRRLRWPKAFCRERPGTPLGPGLCADPPAGASFPEEFRRDRIRNVFLGTRIRLARRADLSIRLGHRKRSSNILGLSDEQVTLLTGAGF